MSAGCGSISRKTLRSTTQPRSRTKTSCGGLSVSNSLRRGRLRSGERERISCGSRLQLAFCRSADRWKPAVDTGRSCEKTHYPIQLYLDLVLCVASRGAVGSAIEIDSNHRDGGRPMGPLHW